MGPHEYRKANIWHSSHLPPILVLAILGGLDTVVVCLATAPWLFEDIHSPRILLAPIVNGALIAMLVVVQITLWNYSRSRYRRWETEADAAFANISRPKRHVVSQEPISEPAVVCIQSSPVPFARFGHFVVYVDDQPVRTSQREPLVNVFVPAGRHQIFIELGRFRSEKVAVDLAGGEQAQLVCGPRPLVRSRFFRFFELKMMFVATPVAIAAFYIPSVMRVVERHFAAEFLAIIVLSQLGFLLSLPRYFSRKPGAMIYLMERPALLERTPSLRDRSLARGPR